MTGVKTYSAVNHHHPKTYPRPEPMDRVMQLSSLEAPRQPGMIHKTMDGRVDDTADAPDTPDTTNATLANFSASAWGLIISTASLAPRV